MSNKEERNKNILDTFKLDGKVAVVTGAAGLYSRQIVETLAEAGAKVFAADFDIEKLEGKMVEFKKAGLDVVALKFDQSSEESINTLFDEIVAQVAGVDILVNSAVIRPMKGIPSRKKTF